jgi:hypothetical protein
MGNELERRPDYQVVHNHINLPKKVVKTQAVEKAEIRHETVKTGRQLDGARAVTEYAMHHVADLDHLRKNLGNPDDAFLDAMLRELEVGYFHKAKSMQRALYSEFGF